ncbi:MAG: cadherin domain-containing protein [Actinomycetota bacterium]|nr:cadherin domain-containing protein [Actinomycetota bacterium]
MSATDQDAGDTQTFSLVAGAGDADNASFQIDGSTLKTNAVFDFETKSVYSIRVRATDGPGLFHEEAFTITVTDVNAAPTDIQLSSSSVAENQPAGTTVGALTTTDPDAGDTHTYSLVAGAGDEDNAKFQISGATLQTAQALDFEADSSLSVRIRTSDASGNYEEAFTITVTNANDAPSDIALSNSTVAENQPAGTNVGSLSATDQDAGATHTFTLVAGAGADDNAKFQISGSTLQTAQPLDFEADSSLSVRVRADDGAGGTFEEALTITVTNANDAPTDIALSNSSVAENQPAGTTVGTLSATDPDAGDTHAFALVAGAGDADNASFQVDGSTLKTNAAFDFETKNAYSIRVRATDGGSATFEKQLTITVTNVNEPPTDVNLSNSSVAENQPAGTSVGTLSTVDDPGSTHTYTLVAGAGDTDNASFQIDGSTLQTAAVFDFETKSSYSVRIRTDDGGGGTFEKQFAITITNANDAPSDIALSSQSVDENQPSGTTVGTLNATDQDSGDTHAFTLVSGAGSTDNASFQITGSTLKTNAVFNFEVKSSYSIRVRVTDSGAATHEEQFTISIVDVNDPPVAVADSYGNAVGNTQAVLGTSGSGPHIVLTGSVVTNNDSDEDAGDTVSAVAETVASTGGGSATIAADGSFRFLPGVGDENQNDTFTYHVTDGEAQSPGTVTVSIANVLVWYVNASAGAGDGRSSSPLNTLAGINGAGGSGDSDTTGDVIFLYSGTYGGGLPLEASQKLTGQPHGLTVDPGSGNVTLVAAGGTNPTIANSGGAGIGLANGVEVQRVNVNGTSGAGVTGTSVTTATIGASTSIGGSTGNAFELSGAASGNIDVASTISSSTARSISVQNRSGGTVAFTGNVTDTGQGILLNANTGATVNLTGSLTLGTGASAGFTATGGGTVNAATATNTVATTTGTALNVQNTTIGSSGLTFRSVAANGAANGIVLNNTGSTAGLTVTGTGAAGSGGTIQNTSGHGIALTSTLSPSFTNVTLQNTGGSGVNGTQVSGFSFVNGTVTGAGDGSDESSFTFDDSTTSANVTGVVTITGNTISQTEADGVDIENSSGTISHANVSNNTLSDTGDVATPGSAIRLVALGNASTVAHVTKATLANNVIANFRAGAGFVAQGGNAADVGGAPAGTFGVPGSGTDVIAITGNRMDGGLGGIGNQPDRFVTASVNGRGQGNFDISGNGTLANPIAHIDGVVIELTGFGPSTVTSTVSNNRIVANNAVASAGIGIGCDADSLTTTSDNGSHTTTISGNSVSLTDGPGIFSIARGSDCTHTSRILNNNVAAPNTTNAARAGIRVDSGSAVGDTTLCLEISGNTTAGSTNTATATTSPGINLRKQGTSTTVNTFGIEGLSPSPAGTPAVENWVNSQNTSTSGNFGVGGTALLSATTGFTSCTAP